MNLIMHIPQAKQTYKLSSQMGMVNLTKCKIKMTN
jgi:hypothetical protein